MSPFFASMFHKIVHKKVYIKEKHSKKRGILLRPPPPPLLPNKRLPKRVRTCHEEVYHPRDCLGKKINICVSGTNLGKWWPT